jgi:hypothetical protein
MKMKKLDFKNVLVSLAAISIMCAAPTFTACGQKTATGSSTIGNIPVEIISISKNTVKIKANGETSLYTVALMSDSQTIKGTAFYAKEGEIGWNNPGTFVGKLSGGSATSTMPMPEKSQTMTLYAGTLIEVSKFDTPENFEAKRLMILTEKDATPEYVDISKIPDDLTRIVVNGKFGWVNRTGKEVIPPKLEFKGTEMDFTEGMLGVILNDKWGWIDKTGNLVIPCKYDMTGQFHEGLAMIVSNGKGGYVNKAGQEVIPVKYNGASWFSNGLAPVFFNDKWGYIDKTGKEIIPYQYDKASTFMNGKAKVTLNGETFYIDKTGKKVE